MRKIEIGRLGELLAKEYLKNAGYTILAENYRTLLGELDLVIKKHDTIIFVEVRTRSTNSHGSPEESITKNKRDRLIRLALQYCAQHTLYARNLRFDVVAINIKGKKSEIKHISNAFFVGEE